MPDAAAREEDFALSGSFKGIVDDDRGSCTWDDVCNEVVLLDWFELDAIVVSLNAFSDASLTLDATMRDDFEVCGIVVWSFASDSRHERSSAIFSASAGIFECSASAFDVSAAYNLEEGDK